MQNKNEMIHKFNHEQFGEIRTIMKDGEPWFVGTDIAKRLGYAKPYDAIANNVHRDDTRIYGIIDDLNRTQDTKLINESGMYTLVMKSKKPDAQKFQRWVTSEVLPSIRKTGAYSAPTAMPTDLASLMQMTQQNAQMMNATVSIMSQELQKVSGTINEIKTEISTWEDKTDNERNNRRISYSQITVDFP